ncbi:MAG: ABC transporter substrate-binding protein [Verrucomicrobiota bacterium]
MGYVLKRLALGITLIGLAAAVLLVSDRQHRRPAAYSSTLTAKGKLWRVAIFQFSSRQILDESVRGCLDAFAKHNLIPDKTVFIQRFNAESDLPTANTIAKTIASGGFDLVITFSTPALQTMAGANQKGQVIHVFGTVTDPYQSGVGFDRKHPAARPRHLAGIGTFQPVKEVFRLAKQCYPNLTRVGVVWCTSETCSEACLVLARKVCQELGIALLEAPVQSSVEVMEAAQSLVARNAQALWIGGDNIVEMTAGTVIKPAMEARIPVFANAPDHTETGALLGLGANYYEVGQATGNLAVEILNGRDPYSVPIENVVPQKLAINLVTLAQLSAAWQITPEIMRTADIIIDAQGRRKTNPALTTALALPRPETGRTYRLGFAYFAPEQGYETAAKGLLEGLRTFGYIEGRNLVVRRINAQAEIATIPAIIQVLDNSDVDVIVTFTTPVLMAAASVAKHKPVVFTYVTDPIAAGIGKSWSDHLPHVTGVGSFPPLEENLAFIQRLIPNLTGLGIIYNNSEANSVKVVAVLRVLCRQRNVRLEEVTLNTTADMAQAVQALLERSIHAVYIPGDNTVYQGFDTLVMACRKARMPLFPDDPSQADKALASIGIGYYESGRGAAPLLARVLSGESPAGIPMTNISVKTIVINQDEANRLGINVPEDLRAGQFSTTGIPISFITPTSVIVTATSVLSTVPKRKWRLFFLQYVQSQFVEETCRGFFERLEYHGLQRNRDYDIKILNAHADMATLMAMTSAAADDRPDLILLTSTPTLQAVLRKVSDIPVVFGAVGDPVRAGAGQSVTQHLPNITGITTLSDFAGMVAVVRECLPDARRIGTLFVPAEINSVLYRDALAEAARRNGLDLVSVAVSTSTEVPDAAMALAAKPVDAICQITDNLNDASFPGIVQAARRYQKPLLAFVSGQAINGGAAVAVARDYEQVGRDMADLALRIRHGESPATIPFQPASRTRLVVNPENAARCGLRLPPELLKRADQVVGQP